MLGSNFARLGMVLLGAGLLAAPAVAQTCLEPPAGLLGWWSGDGDARDLAGDTRGKLVGGVGFSPGQVGDAFRLGDLSGAHDQSVVLSRMAADGLADLSLELWVLSTDADGALVSAANGHPGGDNELLLYQSSGGLRVFVKGWRSDLLPVTVSDGAWHHLAFVREGETGSTYLDGVLVDARAYPAGPLDVGPMGFLLGQEQDCLGGCFAPAQAIDGYLDEVSVYGRALAAVEVQAVFAAGADGKCKPMVSEDPRVGDLEAQVMALGDEIDGLVLRLEDLEAAPPLQEVPDHEHVHDHDDDDDDDDRHDRRHKHKRKKSKKHDD